MAAVLKNSNPTRTNKTKYKKAQVSLTETYEKEQAEYFQSKIDLIKSSAENKQSANAWKTVNEVSGRKKPTEAKLKAKY